MDLSANLGDDVSALRRLDNRAWADTYDRYVTPTYAFIAHLVAGDRALAEELHQETWMIAMSAIDQFAPEQGEFRAWLFGIARRRVAMHFRQSHVRATSQILDESNVDLPADDQLLPTDIMESIERADAVRAALTELDETARDVLINKYVDSLSVAEIADRIGKSPKAVESMLTRARYRLRTLLRSYLPPSLRLAKETP
jgi:RNA polymerase sigma-70 factor (ECF subfamily)